MVLRKLSRTLRVGVALFLAAFSTNLLPVLATQTAYATGGPNEDCSVGLTLIAKYEWNKNTEVYDYEKGLSETTVTVLGDSENGTFSVASGYTVSQVIVKGGQGTVAGTTNGTSGTFSNVGLPEAGNSDKPAEISNLQFCGSVVIPKDATADVDVLGPTCLSASVANVVSLANATLVGELDQSVGEHTATFTANDGHQFADGTATMLVPYTIAAQLTGEQCENPTEPTLVTPDVVIVDLCGVEGDNVTGNVITGINYNVTKNGLVYTVVASPVSNTYELVAGNDFTLNEDGTATRVVTLTTNTGCPTPVTPENPDVTDLCGRANDTYIVPQTTHITYQATKNGNKLTIVATADQGYVLELGENSDWTLNEDGTATYSFTFTNVRCERMTICHRTNAATNPYRRITVSVNAIDGIAGNSGNQADHYGEHKGPVATSTAAAQILKDNKIKWGDIIPPVTSHHEGYNWTAEGMSIYNNDCNVPGRGSGTDVCPNIDGIQLTLPNGLVKDDSGNCVTDQCPLVPGVQTDTTLCPAGGQGGGQVQGDNTTKPQTLGTSTELPAALPSTGGEQNPMLILLASLMAYGIAYLFQGRRQLNQNRA